MFWTLNSTRLSEDEYVYLHEDASAVSTRTSVEELKFRNTSTKGRGESDEIKPLKETES